MRGFCPFIPSALMRLLVPLFFALGQTEGEVSPSGQFMTDIPIAVPAFHGIEPKITFTYSSSPANGWLGAGWTLNGPSYILRMSQGRGAPRFDSNDIFVLDGLELVPCQPQRTSPSCTTAVSAFGTSNGFYSTKTESFRRIQYESTANVWHVWETNGRRRDYAIDADDTRWRLATDTDTHGNQVTWNYQVYSGGTSAVSDSFVSEIAYADAPSAPGADIKFYYANRPDTVTYGIGHHLNAKIKRLAAVDVLFAGKRVRVYALAYHTSNATSGSLLDMIQMFGSDAVVNCGSAPSDSCNNSLPQGQIIGGTSLPPNVFYYNETSGSGFQALATTPDYSWPTFAGDFDGDGKTDYLEVKQAFSTHLSNGDGTFRINEGTPIPGWCQLNGAPSSLAWTCFPKGSSALVGDFNGDGKTDFIALGQNINVFLSKGDGTFQVVSSPAPAFCNNRPANECFTPPRPGINDQLNAPLLSVFRLFRLLAGGEIITGDFNGDGKTDFLVAADNFYAFLSNGDGTFQVVSTKPPSWCGQAAGCLSSSPNHIVIGDIDGDGKTDFVSANGNFDVFRSNGDGSFTWIQTPPPASCTDGSQISASLCLSPVTTLVGDFNGDGKIDFASVVAHNGHQANNVFISNGDGTFTVVSGALPPLCKPGAIDGCLSTAAAPLVGDFNGDGKTDIMSVNTNFDIWLSGGAGNFVLRSVPAGAACPVAAECVNDSYGLFIGDFNGDGKADVLSKGMWLASGGPTDHLTATQNGYGITTTVSYAPSSTFPNYLLPVGAVFQAVSAVEKSDGHGISDTHTYSYTGAQWDAVERRFLGFATKRETIDKAGTVVDATYSQTNACFIQPAKIATKDASGNIYTFTILQYVPPGQVPYHCQIFSETHYEAEKLCNSEITCNQTARVISSNLIYDQYGNLIQKTEHGDLKVQGDERRTNTNFAPRVLNLAAYIVNKPFFTSLTPGEGGNQPLRYSGFLGYDGQASPTKGDLTQRVDLIGPGTPTQTAVTAFTYDSYGNMTSTTNPLGQTVTTQFDNIYYLRPVKTCNALNQCTTSIWDIGSGHMTSTTDPNGGTTTYLYDVLGRLIQVTDPEGEKKQYEYSLIQDPVGHVTGQRIRAAIADGSTDRLWTDTYLDGFRRTYKTIRKGGYQKDVQYADATEQPSASSAWFVSSSANPQWTSFAYDGLQRNVDITRPDGAQQRTTYAIGQVTETDELSHDRAWFTDAYGRKIKIQEHNGSNYATTTYNYDAVGELLQTHDAAGNYSSTTRDGLGHILSGSDPDMGAWQYTVDPVGNLLNRTDAKGQKITYTYDALNRPVTKVYPDGSSTVWKYDEGGHGASVGRLTSVSELDTTRNPKGSAQFSYDIKGRVTSSTKCRAMTCVTINTAFDNVGRLASLTYPDASGAISPTSETVKYGYDASGALTSMSGASPYVTQVTYNPEGSPVAINYGNGTTAQYAYNPQRRWLEISSVNGPSAAGLYKAVYSYDAAGRLTSFNDDLKSDPRVTLHHAYDDLNRLIGTYGDETGHGDESFSYDALGNITSNSALGAYTYPASGCSPSNPCASHPHAVISAGNNKYSYDANGNMLSGDGRTFIWNGDNLPISVITAEGATTFDYDSANKRVAKTGPGDSGPTYYFGPLVERAPNGTLTYSYYLGPSLVARRSASTTWYHSDHLGSVRLVTDAQGNLKQRYWYTSFGATAYTSANTLDDFGFTGQRRNPSTASPDGDPAGLIYMNARYYDATLGRFISPDTMIPDPGNPQSLNRYTYVENNPLSFTDPTGHEIMRSFDPENMDRYQHPGHIALGSNGLEGLWAVESTSFGYLSQLGGSSGAGDAVSAASEQQTSRRPVHLGVGELQCQLCVEGLGSTQSQQELPILELLTKIPAAWASLDEYLQLVPKDESAFIINGSFASFRIMGGLGSFFEDRVEGSIQMALGAFDLLKSALTSFELEGSAALLEGANPFLTALEAYYTVGKIDANMSRAYYGPGNTPWEQHRESYFWHELKTFLFLENPAPMEPPAQQ